jgi:hypothetical protein
MAFKIQSALPHAGSSDVNRELKKVRKAARGLDEVLAALGQRDANPHRWNAKVKALTLLPGWHIYRSQLKRLIDEVSEAELRASSAYSNPPPRSRGRPKGAGGGNRAFNLFVSNLDKIALMTGGNWTLYRSSSLDDATQWKGTLIPAMKVLRPFLPKNFYLSADIGRSLAHLRSKKPPSQHKK